jgi:hypothetical protein
MKTVAVTVLSPEDEAFVMDVLRAMEQRHLIRLGEELPLYLEGPPLTIEELDAHLQRAEKGRFYSAEEVKSRFSA